jgi:hypothetical protein
VISKVKPVTHTLIWIIAGNLQFEDEIVTMMGIPSLLILKGRKNFLRKQSCQNSSTVRKEKQPEA